MSKIKAALVTAILATSSAAMASPSVSWSADARFSFGSQSAPVVRDHSRTLMPAYAMPSTRPTSQISLANYLDLSSGRDVLRVDSNLRASALTLRATRGHAYLEKIIIRFADGSRQVVNLDQWMSTRNPAIEVALRGNRRIETIIITGEPSGRGATYQVFAQASQNVELPRPPVYQPPVHQPPVYQPPVYQPPVNQPPVQQQGLSLASDMSFLNTDGRRFINVGGDKGTFGTLRLQGNTGSTYVQMVKVTFTNGQEQFMSVINKTLVRGQSIDLPLDGRGAYAINQICIWTHDGGAQVVNATGTFNASVF